MNTNSKETVGQMIKVRRKSLKITQEKLAEAMNIPKSTISAYENGKIDIKSSVLVELSEHLETNPNYLLGYEKKATPFTLQAEAMLMEIKDEKVQELLMAQIKALVEMNM